ncbi:membrane-like protein [Sphingobium olei]|uniref:Membrane-like protein n=1 Tax=Sphingobium olei TaxID=420955 RepID=A0ABW3NZZ3_9SPHN|nr:membrane-like protein [Sphingobium sp.]
MLACLVMLGGCSDRQEAAETNQAATASQADSVVAPIPHGDATHDVREPGPSSLTPKPLVSRGTSTTAQTSVGKAVQYRAIGTEPFWAVTVRGTMAVLERPDHMPVRFVIQQDSDDRAIRYQGDGFTLTATEGPCSDGMSDVLWSDRVQIAFGEGTLKGCGGIREDMREEPR